MVMHRAMGRCEVQAVPDCRPGEPEHHHRQSRRIGDHRPSNGLAACRACHTHVHARPEVAIGRGWICATWADPEQVPALIHPRGEPTPVLVQLTTGGTYL